MVIDKPTISDLTNATHSHTSASQGGTGVGIVKLATVTAIDGTATGETTLYTVPTGKSLVGLGLIARVTSYTVGSKTQEVEFTAGANATDYDDFFHTNHMTPDSVALDKNVPFFRILIGGDAVPTYPADTILKMKIVLASDADVEVWAVDVFGYLI